MKPIFTKFIPATHTKPARIKAYQAGGKNVTVSFPQDDRCPHKHAAETFCLVVLCRVLEHGFTLANIGETPDEKGYVFHAIEKPEFQPLEFCDFKAWSDKDRLNAARMAKRLGFKNRPGPVSKDEPWEDMNAAWSSTSSIPGYYCLPQREGHKGGVIAKTKSAGLVFLQDFEDVTGYHEKDAEKAGE